MPGIKKKILILTLSSAAAIIAAVCFSISETPVQNMSQEELQKISEPRSIRILFAGDIMFDRGIRYAAKINGNAFIFEKVRPLLQEADLVVANLEGPITDNKSVSSGTIPGSPNNYIFTFPADLAKTLFKENIRLVSLGNNHIPNFSAKGLQSTKNYLLEEGIEHFGSPGGNRSLIKEIEGVKFAFVAYNEFSGAQEIEEAEVLEEIKNIRADADIVIIFSHWAAEYIKEPADSVKQLAHDFIDKGADLVIGSHPHVIGAIENYGDKKIYYSLGNFIFDQYFSEDVRRGLGVMVKMNKKTNQLEFEEKYFYLQPNGQTELVDDF